MEATQRYLVPRPAGIAFAVRSPAADPRRRIVLALLAGGADAPMQLAELAAESGIRDRREFAALLFQMQRDDWVHGDVRPLGLPHGSPAEAFPAMLPRLSSEGAAVLATGTGLCIAGFGVDTARSRHLAALAANMPRSLTHPSDRGSASGANADRMLGWQLPTPSGEPEFHAVPLNVGTQRFLLILGGVPQLGARAFTDLIGLLSRRYWRGVSGRIS